MVNFTPTTNLAANKALVIDTTSPTVSITSPEDEDTVSGSVDITASASDTNLVGVQFKRDINTLIGTEDTEALYSVSWDTTLLSNGEQSLIAVARDSAGNYATSTAITVTIANDTTPPTPSSGSPSGEQVSGTTEVILSVTTDENATCKYGTEADIAYASIEDTFSTTGETEHTQTISGLSDGNTYTYYIRCEDESSNPNTSDYIFSFSIAEAEEEEQETPAPDNTQGGSSSRRSGGGGGSSNTTTNNNTPGLSGEVSSLISRLRTLINEPNPDQTQLTQTISELRRHFMTLFSTTENNTSNNSLFEKDLEFPINDPDVKRLQQFLNNNGFSVAPQGPGSLNNETTIFGYATRNALIRFQQANNITPAVGYFGPVTRGVVNGMLGI